MDARALGARITVCPFDQYGTVVDMQTGLTAVVTPYLRDKGWGGRIGQRGLACTLERARIPYTTDELRHLVPRSGGSSPSRRCQRRSPA